MLEGFYPPQVILWTVNLVVYSTIAIIGLGTLGSFVATSISELENVEKLILIDHDVVETKNLLNSVYRQVDVDSLKTEALSDIILSKNQALSIVPISQKFIEGRTKLPKTDLILDCRDFTYDRQGSIDVRLYISSRYLIVDCRRFVKYKVKQKGKYLITLTKDDLKYAGAIVCRLISSNAIKHMIKSEIVQKFDLDFSKNPNYNDVCDIVYEDELENVDFVNLAESIDNIKKINKNKELNVIVGSKEYPLVQATLPVKTIKTDHDLIKSLSAVTKILQNDFNTFIIYVYKESNNSYIELVPETGAA